jgi:nucleotide-binding universal stress UspA family protein
MYKTILTPLDGSKRAEAILPHVEELARRYGAEVVLLQVIEFTALVVGPDAAHAEIYQETFELQAKEAGDYLADMQKRLQQKEIQARTRVGHGPAVDEIIKAAEAEKADIIALASHGRTGLGRVFYGSVAAGILHRIDRPLLLIRSE